MDNQDFLGYSFHQRLVLTILKRGGALLPVKNGFYLYRPDGSKAKKKIRTPTFVAIKSELRRCFLVEDYVSHTAYSFRGSRIPRRIGKYTIEERKS